ncbi:glycosyltransferase family protein [Picrophilus oshimae]|uniref:hypothetical protein n=1 Tax=Picrophilus oshimae TaxID=46632 RepID=UPI0009FEE3D3|nr:hypothetical protein [Picrophilus oshimae]
MDQLKILRINARTTFPGGVESYIKNVNSMLLKKNIQTFTFEINVTDYDFDYGGNYYVVKKDNSPFKRVINDAYYDDYVYKKLNEIYNNFKPDIIHLHRFKVDY